LPVGIRREYNAPAETFTGAQNTLGHLRERIWERIALLLGTGLGVGYFPLAPGTVGSLWGVALVWGLQQLAWPLFAVLSFAVVFFLCGIPICTRAAKSLGREDPGEIVFDEIAAFPIVFLLVPMSLATGILGFLWFRLFDIVKPWPANRFERLSRGLGVMADDLIAGIYAAAMLMLSVKVLSLE